jgi:glyoxylase-like metal-dependent hydrolase (beta-lactamase superfamily II)
MTLPRMKFGEMEIQGVSDGLLKTSLDFVLGIDRKLSEQLVGGTPDGNVVIPVNNFLIKRGGNIILVDAGAGNTMQPTLGKLPENLRAAGTDPASVTHIVLTHIHPDHANGLVDDAGQPRYPNAEIVVHSTEADFWLRPAAGVEPEPVVRNRTRAAINFAPYAERIRRVRDGEDVLGFTPVLAPGHTPGHTCWRIGLGRESVLVWGDIVHLSAVQMSHPEAALVYDLDKELAKKSRARILDMVASERMAIAGAHVAAPGFGYVTRSGASYAFEAA